MKTDPTEWRAGCAPNE